MNRGIITILIVFILASCDRPECKNTNDIFNQYSPDKEEYKRELATQMQRIGIENLRYWFDRSINVDGKQAVEVYVQGETLCAKAQLIVADKVKQKGLGSQSGGGYRGAELKDVEIAISKDTTGTNFLLEQVGKIID